MKISQTTLLVGAAALAFFLFASGGNDEGDVDRAVKLALAKERDPITLRGYVTALRNAGRYEQADMLELRALEIEHPTLHFAYLPSGPAPSPPIQTAIVSKVHF